MFEIGAKFEDDGWSVDSLCKKCGERKSGCRCNKKEILPQSQHSLHLRIEKRRGKKITVIGEFYRDKENLKEILTILKKKFATGGSIKGKNIELQGDYIKEAKPLLKEWGYGTK